MDADLKTLQRAFELARSGACTSVDDIKRCLRLEGHQIKEIVGSSIAKQLRALLAEARGAEARGANGQKASARRQGAGSMPSKRGEMIAAPELLKREHS